MPNHASETKSAVVGAVANDDWKGSSENTGRGKESEGPEDEQSVMRTRLHK